jgi:dienelactone hydrolase
VLLFHHAHGLTDGVRSFAATLEEAGHTVHLPDLFDGQVFDDLEEGVAHAGTIGFGTLIERGQRVAEDLPTALVYAGFSLGVLPAQSLAQCRPGARGALLLHACVPVGEFGAGGWPDGVPVEVHAMEQDPFFVEDGDLDAARALVDATSDAALVRYPGDRHLFADRSLPTYDPDAAAAMTRRVLAFLARVTA